MVHPAVIVTFLSKTEPWRMFYRFRYSMMIGTPEHHHAYERGHGYRHARTPQQFYEYEDMESSYIVD